ncbi:LysE/ArgO family amino acid transporter [Candidatus Pandoraea novymonadis]|nr:LysE/ArgO family amino acid transporter [Candidatus Pandoraea novymonadis]
MDVIHPAFFKGLLLCASLIIAIGAQNAFVLRQGILRSHIGIIVVVCSICDILLISAGVAGMGELVSKYPRFLTAVTWGGATFLFWYGLRAWRAAFRGTVALRVDGRNAGVAADAHWSGALRSALMLSVLNPHVYLDTVILLGGVGASQSPPGNVWFALGAMTASVLWFNVLGYGARLLGPLFAKPRAWQILDGIVGTMMWTIAIGLVAQRGIL